jgi:hypothetical protein
MLDCRTCPIWTNERRLTDEDWSVIAFYDSARQYTRRANIDGEKFRIVLDIPAIVARLEAEGIPRAKWGAFVDGCEFLHAMESGSVQRPRFPHPDMMGENDAG